MYIPTEFKQCAHLATCNVKYKTFPRRTHCFRYAPNKNKLEHVKHMLVRNIRMFIIVITVTF